MVAYDGQVFRFLMSHSVELSGKVVLLDHIDQEEQHDHGVESANYVY